MHVELAFYVPWEPASLAWEQQQTPQETAQRFWPKSPRRPAVSTGWIPTPAGLL